MAHFIRLCSLFLLALNSLNAQQRLEFEKVAPMIDEAYAFASAGSDFGVYALAGGDDGSNYSKELQFYDSKLNQWIEVNIPDLPTVNFASGVYLKDYHGLLFLGGIQPYGANTVLADKIRMLNLDEFSITDLGPLPEPASRMGLVNDGNTVYFFGGSKRPKPNFLGSNKFFSYNLETGHLAMLADMPAGRETSGALVGKSLYVFGGYDGVSNSDVWKYDLSTEKWEILPSLEKPISEYGIASYGQYVFLVGDYVNTRQLIIYDTETQKQSYYKMNITGRYLGAAISGDYLYVYGGVVPPPNMYIKRETFRIKLSELISVQKEQ